MSFIERRPIGPADPVQRSEQLLLALDSVQHFFCLWEQTLVKVDWRNKSKSDPDELSNT